jgi:hypothetical protein
MTPKQALYGYIKDHIEVLSENLKGSTPNNYLQQELMMIKRLLEKYDEQNSKEKTALEHLCESQEKLIERRESESREWREVFEGNFEVKETTPEKLNECISDLIRVNDKQQKILDILKKKEVDIGWLENCKSLLDYNFNLIIDYQLTQEECDLLKEWLENV